MPLLGMISLRNLLRQKRRNILLGSAMAIGVMILVIANSFSHGLSDIMFNKIIRWVAGHVTISFNEKGMVSREVCRDKERFFNLLKDEKDIVLEADEAIGMFCKALGNGKADNIIFIGVDTSANVSNETKKEIKESYRLIEGSWEDLEKKDMENPGIISEEKAKYLNVKKNDIIRLRYPNIFGQDQASKITIVGIMKNENIFMQPVVFVELNNAKQMLGFRPYESGNINITIKDPKKNAVPLADRIHAKINSELAIICASAKNKDKKADVVILGYKADKQSKDKISKLLNITDGSLENALKNNAVIIPKDLKNSLRLSVGEPFTVTYDMKLENRTAAAAYKVSAVYNPGKTLGQNVILVNEDKFYETYYDNLPKHYDNYTHVFVPKKDNPWYDLIAPEFVLLPRTKNTDELKDKYRQMAKRKWKATLVDVRTMYESASDILKLEGVLNLITLSAVLVLFFIILLGVVNTLRLSIRERTREIGTIRAIGMQKNDVRNIFLLETMFLSLIASVAGILLAFLAMWGLSSIKITMEDNPLGMLLVNSHLYFLPTIMTVVGTILLILLITTIAAFFPARRASNLSPAKALGHFE
ncbi:MAG: FtsX-like permease family protein [Elusimicrobia bacterium]|nr:FtsX-like permease family protein [Candidatus Liberimonas magnetica]